MKQLLVIAIALASTNAFASRARVTSLGSSAHILDTQSIFSNPAKMFLMGDFVSLESGQTATGTNPVTTGNPNNNAEGTLVRSMGDAKMGLALGHKSENASAFGLRQIMGAGDVTEQQNPVEFSYGMKSGDMTWAATLVYSNYDDKAQEIKENSAGLRLGLLMGAWDIHAGIGLASQVKDKVNDLEFKGTGSYQVYAGYTMNNLYVFGDLTIAGAKQEVQSTGAETHKADQTKITLGVVDSNKKDGNEFFYGAKLVSLKFKDDVTSVSTDDQEKTELTLPIIVGLEAEATSWLTLRGSLTQDVVIDSSKTEVGGTTVAETNPGTNSTVAAVGAGLKFNKITIDGSLEGLTGGAATQNLNGNTLLTTVGLTYMF
ncbi:MAG: hypothetical protein NDI63_13725 [Pseudobdellovibrio sp.]|nr:hypothetical protein [Pseudobdellovibrio sp.]